MAKAKRAAKADPPDIAIPKFAFTGTWRAYQQRLLDLGVDASRVFVTGNMKYDSVQMGDHVHAEAALRPWLAPAGERVLVCGSTHDDEEAFVRAMNAKGDRIAVFAEPSSADG